MIFYNPNGCLKFQSLKSICNPLYSEEANDTLLIHSVTRIMHYRSKSEEGKRSEETHAPANTLKRHISYHSSAPKQTWVGNECT